jgi:hypothetical protein
MIDEGINNVVSRPPSRLKLTEWITESAQGIQQSTAIVKNSWRHADYSYFPRNEEEGCPCRCHLWKNQQQQVQKKQGREC